MLSTFQYHLFNSNIDKILTVSNKTWVMAHQRTVTKNRYIFLHNQSRQKDTYTICIHRRAEHKGWVSLYPIQWCFISKSPPRLHHTRPEINFTSGFLSRAHVNTVSLCWSDTCVNSKYATIRQTNNQPITQTLNQTRSLGWLSLISSPTSYGMIGMTAMIMMISGTTSEWVCLCVRRYAWVFVGAIPLKLFSSLTLTAHCKVFEFCRFCGKANIM